MSQTFDFYDARAREAAEEAGGATLDNVRDRHLRAAASWRFLADQAKAVADGRAKTERDKAALRAAEAEAQIAAE